MYVFPELKRWNRRFGKTPVTFGPVRRGDIGDTSIQKLECSIRTFRADRAAPGAAIHNAVSEIKPLTLFEYRTGFPGF